jgi:hypothetical protein
MENLQKTREMAVEILDERENKEMTRKVNQKTMKNSSLLEM